MLADLQSELVGGKHPMDAQWDFNLERVVTRAADYCLLCIPEINAV